MTAVVAAAPNIWCPHPCPTPSSDTISFLISAFCDNPGSASYSPRIAITGFPFPYSAINACSKCSLFSIVNPSSLKIFLKKLADSLSFPDNSG